MGKWLANEDATLLQMRSKGAEFGEIGKKVKRSASACSHRFQLLSGSHEQESPCDAPSERFEHAEGDTTSTIVSVSGRIRTVEEALEKANVDTDIWEVERFVLNSWEVGAKDDTGKVCVTPLWQVKVWLKRTVRKAQQDGMEALIERLANPRRIHVTPPKRKPSGSHMLEVSLFDCHFGKLAWEHETGSASYDLSIAEDVYSNAIDDLLSKSNGWPIDRILFPIGQDFFHTDNWVGSTHAGTPQDCDGRFQKVFDVGCDAVIRAVEKCLSVAPVDVVYVPGNHDRTTSWYMACVLDAWFRNSKHVSVDRRPTDRHYIEYGATLLGMTHGNEEKHRDLPAIMAHESPAAWARTQCHVWHVGHEHRRRQQADTFTGVPVITIPSLSGTDRWHASKGYVGVQRAADAYLYSREEGFAAMFTAYAKNSG